MIFINNFLYIVNYSMIINLFLTQVELIEDFYIYYANCDILRIVYFNEQSKLFYSVLRDELIIIDKRMIRYG